MNYETIPTREKYGAVETNGVEDMQALLDSIDFGRRVYWSDPDLAKIFRLRLLTDPGFPFWDVSYCYGTMRDGTNVRVQLPFYQLPKRNMKGAIIEHAKRDGVYAKSLGLFDPSTISTVR